MRGNPSLGSAETISTSSGQSFDQRFDPFGAPESTNTTITRAGFTGHAHDNDLGLIDMKGRVYDPLAARFTTADPLMQAPYWSQGMNRYAYVFNDPINATDPSGFISMSDVVGGFVAAGHIGAFVVPAISNGSLPTLGAVGVPTVATSVTTMPGLLQGQPGSGPTVVAANTPSVQEGARGNPSKAAGPKSAGPDPMLCDSGLFECDWEAGTMRMNILIPDAPVGPAPAAGQTASWWARLKHWLFGSEPAAANGAGKAFVRTEAKNVAEKLALDEAKGGAGRRIMQGKINDPKYPEEVWAKMQHVHEHPGGTQTVIHYWENLKTGLREGFKFK